MAKILDVTPEVVDVFGYGGDTLTIEVTVAAGVADGATWNAQVRSERTAGVDSTFDITTPSTPGAPGYLTLPSAETARLVSGSPVVRRRGKDGSMRSLLMYSGVWDCQVSNNGSDPVRTLAQGTLTLEIDVTRLP